MADLERMLLEAAGRKILPARKRHSSPPRKSRRKGSYSGDGCDSKSDDSDGDRVYESDNDSVRSDLYQDEDDREKLSKFERDLILAAGATKRSDRDLTEKLKRSDRDQEADLEKMLREAAGRTALPARNRHSSPPRKSRRKGSYSDVGSDSKSDDSDGDRVYESDNDSVRSDLYQDEDDREKLSKFERDLILAAGATKRSDRDLTEKLKRSDRDQEADLEKMLREAAGRTTLPARNRHSSPPRKSRRKGSYSDDGSDSKSDDSDGDRVYESDNDSVRSDLYQDEYDREKLSKFERDLILAAGATKRSDRDLTEKLKRSDRDQEADLEKMLREAAGRTALLARNRHSSPPRKSRRKGSYSDDGSDSKNDDSDGDRVYDSDNDSAGSDLYKDEDDREKLSKLTELHPSSRTDSRNPCNKEKRSRSDKKTKDERKGLDRKGSPKSLS